MNFWTGLILGIIIGWLVEWIIDWLFWRRDMGVAPDDELVAEQRAAELDGEWQDRLAAAEDDYHGRLAAVEAEWRARLDLNEQQWQDQFAAVEADRTDLRTQLADAAALSTLAVAGAVAGADAGAGADEAAGDSGDDRIIDGFAVESDDDDIVDEFAIESDDDRLVDEFDTPVTDGLIILPAADEFAADYTPPPAEFADAASYAPAAENDYATRDLTPVADEYDTRDLTPVAPVAPRRDDLSRVRGIGPRYAALLAERGIVTYDDLAAADPEQLRAIINPGPMHRLNFTSWTAQAAAFAATRDTAAGDDLTKLEGIGPMYAARLNDKGITTFAQLAATDEGTLADVISAPAWRRINYADWKAQAELAAAGDTAGLQALQTRLFRREGDNLGLIRGIGQRSATGLRAAGFDTFAALAAATPQQVEEAVRAAGGRGGDYEAWIAEAGQRAAGRRVPRATRRVKAAYVVACPQDLSAVPGIGTVFEQRLYAAGIGSYWELAELPTDELERILGERPGGVSIAAIKTAAMQLAATSNSIGRAWDGTPPDDFEEVGGIGEIYERRLYEAGICTFAALAATAPERLAEICQAPHMRLPDYAAWITHAAELTAARSG